ncbi:hypothetical protein BHE74_00015335 [Ensete ventricosum]|nr:hypothetical protein BHE74_00015335 [Ensete ventricosum]RZS09108.1 hypothetical protein BHM03_00040163 [Ensete ventricosum]
MDEVVRAVYLSPGLSCTMSLRVVQSSVIRADLVVFFINGPARTRFTAANPPPPSLSLPLSRGRLCCLLMTRVRRLSSRHARAAQPSPVAAVRGDHVRAESASPFLSVGFLPALDRSVLVFSWSTDAAIPEGLWISAVSRDKLVTQKMDAARNWFHKLQPRGEKLKPGVVKKEAGSAKDMQKPPVDEVPSNITKQKVAAAKQYIENHYKAQMKSLQDRKER